MFGASKLCIGWVDDLAQKKLSFSNHLLALTSSLPSVQSASSSHTQLRGTQLVPEYLLVPFRQRVSLPSQSADTTHYITVQSSLSRRALLVGVGETTISNKFAKIGSVHILYPLLVGVLLPLSRQQLNGQTSYIYFPYLFWWELRS